MQPESFLGAWQLCDGFPGANCCSLMSTAKKLGHYFVVIGKKSAFPFPFLKIREHGNNSAF